MQESKTRATRILLRGWRGVEQKKNFFCTKNISLGGVLNKPVQIKGMIVGSLEAEPPYAGGHGVLGNFCDFSGKYNHFKVIWFTFCTFVELLKREKMLRFLNNWNNLKLHSPFNLLFYLLVVQNTFKR